LAVSKPREGQFSPEEKERLALLGQQATLRLSAFELVTAVARGGDEAVDALERALEARGTGARAPSEQLRAWVQALGRETHLPSQMIEQAERGALLRDLGKIGTPDAVLLKAGKLAAEEYALVKRHPTIGYKILRAVPALAPVASIVLYHQEWFNGEGYPEGLAGEEIPLAARLVGVIDAWDAMTSERPYRAAMPTAAAVAELRRQAGTQFDPKMVDSFLRVVDRLEREEAEAASARPAPAHA
jgi:HD-GYP domain-containing protein (c-di-GMP phosphodiesterase class II)